MAKAGIATVRQRRNKRDDVWNRLYPNLRGFTVVMARCHFTVSFHKILNKKVTDEGNAA